jgi:hypothetical protein
VTQGGWCACFGAFTCVVKQWCSEYITVFNTGTACQGMQLQTWHQTWVYLLQLLAWASNSSVDMGLERVL